MKKNSIIVYSVFAVIIYVFAICYFAFNLAYEFSNGSSRTRRRFDHTTAAVQESITKINNDYYDANEIKNLIITSFGSMNDFAYIEFFENGQTIYSYKTNTLEANSESKLLHNYTSTFRVGNNEYFFTANLYNLRPTSIFIYGKRAFLIILIVTIITFILIFVTNLKSVQSESSQNEIEDETEVEQEQDSLIDETTDEDENTTESEDNSQQNNEEVTEEVVFNGPTEAEQKALFEEVKEEQTDEPILSDITAEVDVEETGTFEITEVSNEDIPVPSEVPEEIEYEAKQDLPEGLYSPETGLSYEPFLESKLNNEINRSIASENDLSLFLIKIPGLEKNSVLFKQICNYLIIQFQYKELVFEYKSDSIAAIKVNSTIDESITFADKIHADIKNILNDDNLSCYIGITSRTIRMVNAERLLLEADEALEHSKEDKKCPIIAFRADAEKFRLANL